MNFLMNKTDSQSTKDKVDYRSLVDAIIKISEISFLDYSEGARHAEIYYVQYFLNRLMFGLPPPHEYLQTLSNTSSLLESKFLDSPARVLYLIIWISRLQHRTYSSWIRDILCKQGMIPVEAENLIKSTALGSKTGLKILNKSIDWVVAASESEPGSKCPSLYFAIEAVLSHSITTIEEISEDEELLVVMIRILEESLLAVQNRILDDSIKRNKGNSGGEHWKSSAMHLISISSGFLMNNPMSKIVMKCVDPNLKGAMEECVNEDFDSFPGWSMSQYKSDILPGESYLLAVLDGHMSANQGELIFFY